MVLTSDLFQVIPLLSHPNNEIVREVLAFLKTILFSGNQGVQRGLEYLLSTREEGLCTTVAGLLRNAASMQKKRWVKEIPLGLPSPWCSAGVRIRENFGIWQHMTSKEMAARGVVNEKVELLENCIFSLLQSKK